MKLDELENEATIILCQLEMYFPPTFFDIMVHLIVHLVREIKCCGPVFLRWMYLVKRYMKILKGYTKIYTIRKHLLWKGSLQKKPLNFVQSTLKK